MKKYIVLSCVLCAIVSCGPSKKEKAKQTQEEKARIEALAQQKADSIAKVEQEERQHGEELARQEQQRIEEEERAAAEAALEAERENQEAEKLLNGYWGEITQMEDARYTDGFQPFLEAYNFNSYSHSMKIVRLYISKTTTEFSFTYRYENGNIYVTHSSGKPNNDKWFTFNKNNMVLHDSNGKTLHKIR